MKNRKIQLIASIDFNGQTITHVLLREPNGAEFIEHGEIYQKHPAADGSGVIVENGPAIAAYLSAIIVEPSGLPLERVGLADAMRLKDAVTDFFGDARQAGWKTEPTASSSSSDGSTPAASAAPL